MSATAASLPESDTLTGVSEGTVFSAPAGRIGEVRA